MKIDFVKLSKGKFLRLPLGEISANFHHEKGWISKSELNKTSDEEYSIPYFFTIVEKTEIKTITELFKVIVKHIPLDLDSKYIVYYYSLNNICIVKEE